MKKITLKNSFHGTEVEIFSESEIPSEAKMKCEKCKKYTELPFEPTPKGWFRHAYGTTDGLWHSVCPHDRDYETAITWEYFMKWGHVISKDKYLSQQF